MRAAAKFATEPDDYRLLPIERFSDIQPQLSGLWLVKRLLPASGLALFYGHPGSGKTFFVLDGALHIALGWDWLGRKVRQGLVIYVGAEGVSGLRNRIVAFRRHHEVEGDIPFSLIPCPIDLQAPDADVKALAATVRAEAAAFDAEPVLIVIDTLSKTFGAGKENTDDMATYVSNCQRLSAEFSCCVVPVHHRPKDAESTEPRGHSSLKGGVDTVVLIEAGATKRAEVTKQKDGELGERMLFNLRVVELGEDEDGETVTSCVVEPTEIDTNRVRDPFAMAVGKLSAGNRLVYEQLGELLETEGTQIPTAIPEGAIDRGRVGKVASLDAWRDKSISAAGTGAGHNRDTGKRAFNRALPALRNAGVVRVWEEWAWITHHLAGTVPGQPAGRDRDTGTGGTTPFRECPVVPPVPTAKSALIFAPGETGDEPVPGWED
ncbi:AAA family ATPase [Sphingomonas qomolangmaensis]|uniref:Helicase RepA family protein n=1 Tax=Sphingomonas qomolangmaensis TaxID=2918765 RepID=A0ABY5LFF6_9SPHN|nr:AAA family ATPase [Sphingomonas qomolangmaensis]UUL83446.1 helicase RepA family protein [Sphingomonas qomolangmaensis]